MSYLGVVVIGRNEGERLKNCLASIMSQAAYVVYVDSGSTDGSAAMARNMGANVVELDLTIPFTAARARNEGFDHLLTLADNLRYVQFVDGDCEIVSSWIEAAQHFMEENPSVAVVCGRRRERFPNSSLYNRLCDMEWDTPIGEAKACGGDSMMRVEVFRMNRFRSDLIAGEEPELCVRLRKAGWKIWRIDQEMTLHDAAITRFKQWWKRAQRGGYAYAEGVFLHGATAEKYRVKESVSIWFWACWVPALIVLFACVQWQLIAGFLVVYPLQIGRLVLRGKYSLRDNWLRAGFLMLGKFAELYGQVQFIRNRLIGVKGRLIEYK